MSTAEQKPVTFHPIVKACAYFGALFAIFAATTSFASIFAAATLWDSLAGAGRAAGCLMLAWLFWYAGKYSKNPFKVPMFTR